MFFVQFPHPGGEHNPPGRVMPWNTGKHRRKFLLAPGRYLDQASEVNDGERVFWGEWEAPSQVINRWPPSGRLPRALHRPYWTLPAGNGWRQNTDPWVFGERMLYSNCKQTLGPDNRPTSLQRLTRGSVICFGSAIDGKFCADMVPAVASAAPWTPADATIGLGGHSPPAPPIPWPPGTAATPGRGSCCTKARPSRTQSTGCTASSRPCP